jgi:hypothetical protein
LPAWAFAYAARLHKRASERRLPLRAFVYARRPLKAARSGHCSRSLLSRGSTISTRRRLLRRRRSTRTRRCAPLWATSAKGHCTTAACAPAAALRRSAAQSVRPLRLQRAFACLLQADGPAEPALADGACTDIRSASPADPHSWAATSALALTQPAPKADLAALTLTGRPFSSSLWRRSAASRGQHTGWALKGHDRAVMGHDRAFDGSRSHDGALGSVSRGCHTTGTCIASCTHACAVRFVRWRKCARSACAANDRTMLECDATTC